MNTSPKPLDLRLARLLTLETEPYLSCDECFDRLDTYVEALVANLAREDTQMRVHLEACPACAEEAASLMLLLTADETEGRRA